MTRLDILQEVVYEREYQDGKWGAEFDRLNTPNDWVAYLAAYVGKAVTLPWNRTEFRKRVLQVAAICFAILEREDYAPRHYDPKAPAILTTGGKGLALNG